jgi:hypothetical protein
MILATLSQIHTLCRDEWQVCPRITNWEGYVPKLWLSTTLSQSLLAATKKTTKNSAKVTGNQTEFLARDLQKGEKGGGVNVSSTIFPAWNC